MPAPTIPASDSITLLSDQDLYLFNEGSNYRMHETMGAHLIGEPRATAKRARFSASGRRMRAWFR